MSGKLNEVKDYLKTSAMDSIRACIAWAEDDCFEAALVCYGQAFAYCGVLMDLFGDDLNKEEYYNILADKFLEMYDKYVDSRKYI